MPYTSEVSTQRDENPAGLPMHRPDNLEAMNPKIHHHLLSFFTLITTLADKLGAAHKIEHSSLFSGDATWSRAI